MTNQEMLQMFYDSEALLQGHFELTSGKHTDRYVQCAQVLRHPKYTQELVAALAEALKGEYDLVVGPALGGIIVAYEMGRYLGIPAMFTEREGGKMTFRRGFRIAPDQRVLVVEDVITTGGSVQETIECVQREGGVVEEAAVLIDRSGGNHILQVPLTSLLEMELNTFEPMECPLCKSSTSSKPIKPGSRGI